MRCTIIAETALVSIEFRSLDVYEMYDYRQGSPQFYGIPVLGCIRNVWSCIYIYITSLFLSLSIYIARAVRSSSDVLSLNVYEGIIIAEVLHISTELPSLYVCQLYDHNRCSHHLY